MDLSLGKERGNQKRFALFMALSSAAAMAAVGNPAVAQGRDTVRVELPSREGEWALTEVLLDRGIPSCVVAGKADASTVISLTTDAKDHPEAYFVAENQNWSIKKGDDVGEIQIFADEGYHFSKGSFAIDHGIAARVDESDFLYFLKLAKGRFGIKRNGKVIARYDSGNLSEMVSKLEQCGAKLSALDPFAKPTPSVAVPPKPINKMEWIGSIEKAYFAGPPTKCILCIRKMERNSEPAQVKFKLTVDEQGRLIKCEVLESSGYADWRDEFCRLTMNFKLEFTPAISNAGRPIAGEYVDVAGVAFN